MKSATTLRRGFIIRAFKTIQVANERKKEGEMFEKTFQRLKS